ncbi:MAG: arsenite efflux transporter metallochaperone ArsD [Clostridia bacterium]|nr:arsenite efflux transporter metallochaperone ArsD [Clostridia bacterium]
MSKIQIFDPAMCCSTGVCGPSVNPQLLRVATIINNLKQKGIIIERYNLNSNPKAFVDNTNVNELLKTNGVEILPITVVDGVVIKTKEYFSNEEFSKYLNISISEFIGQNKNRFNLKKINRR